MHACMHACLAALLTPSLLRNSAFQKQRLTDTNLGLDFARDFCANLVPPISWTRALCSEGSGLLSLQFT